MFRIVSAFLNEYHAAGLLLVVQQRIQVEAGLVKHAARTVADRDHLNAAVTQIQRSMSADIAEALNYRRLALQFIGPVTGIFVL